MGHRTRSLRLGSLSSLFVLALILVTAGPAYTGGAASVTLSPPSVDLTVEPGKEATFEVYVGNNSISETARFKVFVAPVEQDRSGSYRVSEKPLPSSAVQWLEAMDKELTIPPGRGANVPVKVKVPRGSVGSRAAAVVFEIVADQTPSAKERSGMGGTTTFVHRLITVVKVTANSRSNRRDASITSIAVTTPATDARLAQYGANALAIVASVQNEGNAIIAGQGRLVIRNLQGRRVKEVPLGAGRGIVLPGSTVDFMSVFLGGLPEGNYTAEALIRYGGYRPLQARIPVEVKAGDASGDKAQVTRTVRLQSTPETLEAQLPPGAHRTFTVNLVNRENQPVNVHSRITGLVSDGEGALIPADDVSPQWSAAKWLALETDSFALKPGERKNVRVTMSVPKDTTVGTHYASIVFEAESSQKGRDSNGGTTAVSTPVVVTAGKQLAKKATIMDAKVVPVAEPESLVIGGQLLNQGNTHLTISGNVTLKRRAMAPKLQEGLEYLGEAQFEEVETIPLPASEGWLLPGSAHVVAVRYDKPLEAGEYQAEILVDFGGDAPVKAMTTFLVAPQGTDMDKIRGSSK